MLVELPSEVVLLIFERVNLPDICNLAITNKKMYEIYDNYKNSISNSYLHCMGLNCPSNMEPSRVVHEIYKMCSEQVTNMFVISQKGSVYSKTQNFIYNLFYQRVFWTFAFETSVNNNNVNVLKLLIYNQLPISRSLFFHCLRVACNKNHYETVRFLLNCVPKNEFYERKKHPINLTCYDLRQLLVAEKWKIVKLLIEYGAKINYMDIDFLLNYFRTNSYKILEILDIPNVINYNQDHAMNYDNYDEKLQMQLPNFI